MDRLESLGNQLSQITLYDIKSMYNQAKNVVLNISEMEAKVREATNDETWGASSTLMHEIAQGTFNFQQFNEIMPCIYGRFMEKEARQWRQIYKSLQLLEFLIKHGSERVVDDARSHIGTLKMLRSFHYIDEKGKDEGINVRTRAKELVELLSDVEKIRTERRKAKANKNKYIGVGNDGAYGMSFGSGSGGRYGGSGNESWGSGGGGDGSGGYSSSDYYGNSRFSDSGGRKQYEEYNAGEDETLPSGSRSSSTTTTPHRSTGTSARSPPVRKGSAPTTTPAPAPVPNLLDFDDDVTSTNTTATIGNQGLATNKALPKPVVVGLDDDDFDDFQTAPVPVQTQVPVIQSPTTAGQTQVSPPLSPIGQQQQAKPNLLQLLNANAAPLSPTGMQQQPQAQTGFGGGMGMGIGMQQQQLQQGHRATGSMGGLFGVGGVGGMRASGPTSPLAMGVSPMQPMAMGSTPMRANTAMSPASQSQGQKKTATGGGGGGGGGFDDLWNLSLASSSTGKTSGAGSGSMMKSMKDIQQEKSSAGLWGGAGAKAASGLSGSGGPVPGGFGAGRSAGGGDDLLL